MPGTDREVNKTDKNPWPHEAHPPTEACVLGSLSFKNLKKTAEGLSFQNAHIYLILQCMNPSNPIINHGLRNPDKNPPCVYFLVLPFIAVS